MLVGFASKRGAEIIMKDNEERRNLEPTEGTLAIIDTNVFIDIHSCHDLIVTFDGLHAKIGNAAIEDPSMTYRLARARESALLAIYLNKIGATTFSLHNEAVEMLMRNAPPAPGGTCMKSDFTTVFLHFVKDYVLPDWIPTMPTEPGTEAKSQADAALIKCAKEHSLPLITNEGYSEKGLADIKMRKLARVAGVQVFAPREFCEAKIDEAEEIEAFLRRFRERAPAYLREHDRRHGPDETGKVLGWVVGYYRMILQGVVEGRETRVRVAV